MGIITMTVRLGLVKASLLSMVLLSVGGILIGGAFFVTFASGHYPLLSLSVFAIATADFIVLQKLMKLYTLSKEYETSGQSSIAHEITSFSADNPKWIMLVTQTYSLISLIMLISEFLG